MCKTILSPQFVQNAAAKILVLYYYKLHKYIANTLLVKLINLYR